MIRPIGHAADLHALPKSLFGARCRALRPLVPAPLGLALPAGEHRQWPVRAQTNVPCRQVFVRFGIDVLPFQLFAILAVGHSVLPPQSLA